MIFLFRDKGRPYSNYVTGGRVLNTLGLTKEYTAYLRHWNCKKAGGTIHFYSIAHNTCNYNVATERCDMDRGNFNTQGFLHSFGSCIPFRPLYPFKTSPKSVSLAKGISGYSYQICCEKMAGRPEEGIENYDEGERVRKRWGIPTLIRHLYSLPPPLSF
jgi:hypothetical protein